MLVLAFDTTSPDGSAALVRDFELLGEVRAEGTSNYSVALFDLVDRLLAAAGMGLNQIELFAAATGPGSFTGIRVGLAAAQAWAKAFGRPVRGVSVLEAMVAAAEPRADVAVPLLDARRSEFYLGVFRRHSQKSRFELDGEGLALSTTGIASLAEEIAGGDSSEAEFIVCECDRAAIELSKRLPGWIGWDTVSKHHAASIGAVAVRAAREGKLQLPEDLDAWYIRRPDAEIHGSE